MVPYTSLAIIALAGLIHASFQLSVSVLTLFSGHAIGAKTSHAKVVRLINSFSSGAAVMTLLLLSFVAFVAQTTFRTTTPNLAWAVACGMLMGLGVAIWAFYYRRADNGTSLWLPRGMARYLTSRSKQTRTSAEAFGLGLSSVAAELLFIIGPVFIAALALLHLRPEWQLVGLALYTILSMTSLATVTTLVGSGHKLSAVQRWRETNKRFLQFAAGSAMIVLGFYVYVDEILSAHVWAAGVLH